MLRSASKAACTSRPPPRRLPCAVTLPNAAFPYGKSCNCTDSHKNNSNKLKRRRGFRRKAGNVPIPRKLLPIAVFVCRGYNDMRQRNQTRRVGDAGDKAARTCRKADAALSAVRREAQARLYRQQWRSPKRGAVKAAVRCGTDCRYIHRRRKRCEEDAAIAGRPSAPSSQPAQHGAQARLHALRNRYPAQTRPSLYARAQRQGCAPSLQGQRELLRFS